MSKNPSSPSDKANARGPKAFKRTGFQFLGLGVQDMIRVFFGGNASIAIVILVLICVFLAKEAFWFFPDHHEGLKSYRKSGQEFVDYMKEEVDAYTSMYSSANIAYYAEINRTSRTEDTILRAYRAVLANLENLTSKTWGRLEREVDALEETLEGIEDLDPEDENHAAELAALEEERDRLQPLIVDLRAQLKKEVEEKIESEGAWYLGVGSDPPPSEALPKIKEAVLFEASPEAEEVHPYIEEIREISREKKAEQSENYANYKETLGGMRDAIRPLRSLISDLRKPATENKKEIVSFSTAPARKAAWLKGAEEVDDPAERERMLQEAAEVDVIEPDYDAINQVFYEAAPRHAEIIGPLEVEMAKLYDSLPGQDELETKSARENLERAEVFYKRFTKRIEENRQNVKEWRHDKPLSAVESVTAFLFGKDWVTNSSWHDFYGLLPIFSGSFLIAVIALVVAVPFAVSAAIYVNQLAPHREQTFIKPAIEFIEAIPSVVLGFFGILVFGETLRSISQVEWLEWVPGFPMAERLTILNAGLLLALMAVPTIFTLTEDALNNVPQALTENSLAMGATKLQTVFRVVVPTAISGMIAAILLGFGRIIGETMVVLLVAGNKIKIPDFTEGVGVIAQPAHTMTGIIAQELGEVDAGSLHWRALFMVGMVLFVISLIVNFSAQRVLKRFQKF